MNKGTNLIIKIAYQRTLKMKSIFVLVAIMLTTMLFSSLSTVGFSVYESFQQQTIKQTNNSAHGAIMYISDSKFKIIKNHSDLYKELGYFKIISDSVDNKSLEKQNVAIVIMNEAALKMTFCEPTVGAAPTLNNEIAMDTVSLKNMGITPEVGNKVTIQYTVGEDSYTKDFVLSGFWEANILSDVSYIIVSESFVNEKFDNLVNTYSENCNMAGVVHAYITFNSDKGIETSMYNLLKECNMTEEESNVNWAYISNSLKLDFSLVLCLVLCLAMIMITGYMIINNIFQISVANDVQFYGLLKIVGFTNSQLKRLLIYETTMLTLIGIIVGEIVGYFIGISVLPLIISMTTLSIVEFSFNPRIFIFSALFSITTVIISTYKPWKIVTKLPPIEAIRY